MMVFEHYFELRWLGLSQLNRFIKLGKKCCLLTDRSKKNENSVSLS